MTTLFEVNNRGYSQYLVLLPGWGFNSSIFNVLDFSFNYIFPVNNYKYESFVSDLNQFLEDEGIEMVSVLGFSMGGYLAFDFAKTYPKKIVDLLMLGVRPNYLENEIRPIKILLRKNKNKFMMQFYKDCFSDFDDYAQFCHLFQEDFLLSFEEETLQKGLDYLSGISFDLKELDMDVIIIIIHGVKDVVAPIEDTYNHVKSSFTNAYFYDLECGHMPFFDRNSVQIISEILEN